MNDGGRKDHFVTINYKANFAVMAHHKIRPEVDEDRLCLTTLEKPPGIRSIRHLIRKCLDEAAIPDASTHSMQHTFVAHYVKQVTRD